MRITQGQLLEIVREDRSLREVPKNSHYIERVHFQGVESTVSPNPVIRSLPVTFLPGLRGHCSLGNKPNLNQTL